MTVAYTIGQSLYLNITNRCTNNCVFCIRRTKEGVGYDLWLSREPNLQELLEAVGDPGRYKEVVFCGYGEPLIRLELVIAAAAEFKKLGAKQIRINTNGQANIIHQRNVVPELAGLVDVISISLNAQNAGAYAELSQPVKYSPEEAYSAVLEFARQCKKYIPRVVLSVVNWPGVDIEACRKIAEELEVEFRVREFYGNG
ncbi:TatD family-associated radical SAM protein [Desulfohalotomaculum tongense]|uniref:TatD family nuclease-associated radical SAM protein n=1 Tax=Desulforadius tongensis TaxID=1216062 RepID=UPI001A9CA145|nr:TatD family nuclease-associated radical SAM protein [Desulforadius tongensis]MBM7855307.1 TatD family-associated radical SAM protein [Desulforadius tongensis]